MKSILYICVFIGSIIGGLIGAKIDNENIFDLWNLPMGEVGSLAGIWVGYNINKNISRLLFYAPSAYYCSARFE